MGCDIHTHVEIQQHVNGEEKWCCADYFKLNRYFDGIDESEKEYETVEICGNRNYSLFAVLADVRNYGDTASISKPKGIPDDSCEQIKKDFEYWDCDAHSASYFTLKELMEWQKTAPPLKYSGYISPEASNKLDKGILPECWCQFTNQSDWVRREWEEKNTVLEPVIESLIQRGKELYLWFNDEQIEEHADKMRFVFWFDN